MAGPYLCLTTQHEQRRFDPSLARLRKEEINQRRNQRANQLPKYVLETCRSSMLVLNNLCFVQTEELLGQDN